MEDWSSEFEQYLSDNEGHHSIDLPSQVDGIPLMEAAVGWHLTAIPNLPPTLVFIPISELETTAISDVAEPYQSNLASHNDLTPLHLYPLPPDEVEGEVHFSPYANSTTTVLHGSECKRNEKTRNLSSSDSSKTSDVCFMSADEGDSLTEELFYDPMKVELMEKQNEIQEAILGLMGKEEASLDLCPIMVESRNGATEKPFIYDDTKESEEAPSLDEGDQSGVAEVSTETGGSSGTELGTGPFNTVYIGQKSTFQFGGQLEARVLCEAVLGSKSSEDDVVVNEDVLTETVQEAIASPFQLTCLDDGENGGNGMNFEKDRFNRDLLESSLGMEFGETPSQQLTARRRSIISANYDGEKEAVLHLQDSSLEEKSMVLDETRHADESEIAGDFDKIDEFVHSTNAFKGKMEHDLEEESVDAAVPPEDLFSIKNSKAGNLDVVKQEGGFEPCSEGIASKMNFASEKVAESASETYENIDVEVPTAMLLVAQKEPLEVRHQAGKIELSSYFYEVLLLQDANLFIEERKHAGSSEVSCAFNEVCDLPSITNYAHQTITAESGKNGGILGGSIKTDLVSPLEAIALRKSLLKDPVESTPETDDVVCKTTLTDNTEAAVEPEKSREGEMQSCKYEKEKLFENLDDYLEESNSDAIPNLDLSSQIEPLREKVQVGESESVQFLSGRPSPEGGGLLLDAKKQAGSSEISSSFVKNEDSAASGDLSNKTVVEKLRTQGGESVSLDAGTITSQEDPSIRDQQKAGSSEIASAFDKESEKEESPKLTTASLLLPENVSALQDSGCGLAPLKFVTEESKEDEVEISEEFSMEEELDQTTFTYMGPLMGKFLPEVSETVVNLCSNVAENAETLLDDSKVAETSEMFIYFDGNGATSHSNESSNAVVVEASRTKFCTAKVLNFEVFIPSHDDGAVREVQTKPQVRLTQNETVLGIELEELGPNDMPYEYEVPISTDTEPLRGGLKAHLAKIFVGTGELQVENVDGSHKSIVQREPIKQYETSLTELESVKVPSDLQPLIGSQNFGFESIDCCNNEELATIILHPETYSVEYHLPQNQELHALEQPSTFVENHKDFDKHVIKGMQQSAADQLTTLSSEFVVSEDNRSWAEQCEIHGTSNEDSPSEMSVVRRHSIQLRRQSSHFSLNINAFDTSKSLFETWSEKDKPERGRYYVSFTVEAFRRRETSPDLVSVEEDEAVERVDGDNPDRWVVEAAAPDRCGRLASVCVLEKPVASHYRHSTGKSPREQFRDEVLTISNKQQECMMKRKHALTDLSEEEEGYQLRIKMLRNILERLDGTQIKDDKKLPLPKEMIEATKRMLSHIDRIVNLSESTLTKLQTCVMDPPNAATCFLQNESEWAQYSGYFYHLNRWMESFKPLLTDPKLNHLFCMAPENDEQESRIDAQHLLEYLFAPRTHLSAYEHLLSCLARYTSRNEQDTRCLEKAITVVRRLQRRSTEALRLWPFIANMPVDGSLGVLPSSNAYVDANQLPKPITRMTLLNVSQSKMNEGGTALSEEGFLVLNEDNILFIKALPNAEKKYEISWILPLSEIRLRPESKGLNTERFEIWNVTNSGDSLKVVYTISTPNACSRQAWLQDIQRALKKKDIVDYLVDVTLLRAHEEAAAEANQTRTSLLDDTNTEATDGITDSFYDAEEMLKSRTYDSDAILPQSRDSVNTLDGVINPFMEQIPEGESNTAEISQVLITQSIKTEKPYVHRSEPQHINSSEGGEMELNIETSTSDNDNYTTEWTFNGTPIDAENMGAYPRTEGNTAYLLVPKVSKKLHEGCYECTLTWPSGMQAIFPFAVVVHDSEAGIDPTNEVSKLSLKTVELSRLAIPNEDEEGSVEFHDGEIILLPETQNEIYEAKETSNTMMSEAAEDQKRYRVAKMGIIHIDHEPPLKDVSLMEDADATVEEETIDTSVVSTTLNESPVVVKPFIQKYIEPTKIDTKEGGPFKLIALEVVDTTSSVSWTLNGRRIPINVFEVHRRPSSIELTKPTLTSSDSGEYTLWVDGKMKANFVLNVEKGIEEEPQSEETEVLEKEEIFNEKKEDYPVGEKETEINDLKQKSSQKSEIRESRRGDIIQLTEGDKLRFDTQIPLDARQMKSNRLWWTKNGKPLVDVDGVVSRSSKFTAKSITKSPGSTTVELVKKDSVSVEDAATYVLMGEPRIRRGFRPQETAYATIVVSVVEKPKIGVDEGEEEVAAIPTALEEKKDESVKEIVEAEEVLEGREAGKAKPMEAKGDDKDSEGESMTRKKSLESAPELKVEAEQPILEEESLSTLNDFDVKLIESSQDREKAGGIEPEKTNKELSSDGGGNEGELIKGSFESDAESKPVKTMEQSVGAFKSVSEDTEGLPTEKINETARVSQTEKVGETKARRKTSKDKSREELQTMVKPLEGEAEEQQGKANLEGVNEVLSTLPPGGMKTEEPIAAALTSENIVKLIEGDKFQLVAKVPLDSRQMKSDRLWWTKDGKLFLNVDGVTPRTAKFLSRSTPKSPKSTEVELIKKEPTDMNDAATYKLLGEPRLKRGFRPQETTYATIVVSVVEKPKSHKSNDDELQTKEIEDSSKTQPVQLENDNQNQQEEVQSKDISQEKVKESEVRSRRTIDEDDAFGRKAESGKSSVDVSEQSTKDQNKETIKGNESPTESKEAVREKPDVSGAAVKYTEGDKLRFDTQIPLDARQMKSNRLWWTKNGKPLVDVDGVVSRSSKFTAKSITKSPGSTTVELVKKDSVSVEDAATYVLMGEPRIRRGFRPQETAYATIVVSVVEKPKIGVDEGEEEVAAIPTALEEKKDESVKEIVEAEEVLEGREAGKAKPMEAKGDDKDSEEKSLESAPEFKGVQSVQEKEIESPLEVEKESPSKAPSSLTENVVSLTTGDKLQLATLVPLDARHFKNEKLWWTKDGKPFLDVDGITSRSAKFVSRSKPDPPQSTIIEMTKKEPATVEDAATYVLMGEPRIKRGFKSQEKPYATIIVKVSDAPSNDSSQTEEVSSKIPASTKLKEEEQIDFEALAVTEEKMKVEDEEKAEGNQVHDLKGKPEEVGIEEKKEKRKKKSKSSESEGEEGKRKSRKKKVSEEVAEKLEEAAPVEEKLETKLVETVELRCIEANANRRLGHEKIPVPAGEPLCLTVTGVPPEVTSVSWTLNGQPVRSGKRVQRLLEPNPLGKRYDGELMAQLYLDSTVLLDSGDYELTIVPTDTCPIKGHLSIPVEIVSAKKALAKQRSRTGDNGKVEGEEENVNVLQVQPNLCQPLGFTACEGQSISLVADLSVPVDKVPPESVSWSRNGIPLSPDDPCHDFSIKASEKNRDHTSVILHKPAVTLDDVGFYSVTYNPLPTIKEEPLAEAADEEGYGTGWEVDFPELLVFPAEAAPCPSPSKAPIFTKELPKEIRVLEGDTITLDAEIAEPIHGITPIWSVNGHDINPSRTSEYVVWDSGNYFALTIPAAGKHHLGDYELRLTSGQGKEPIMTSCHVRGKSDFGAMPFDTPNRAIVASHGIVPMFTKKLTDLDCLSGETMELTCRVVGDPIPHFFWRHNGEIVESDYHHRVRSYDNTSTLKIFSIEPKDRGTYICSAVNELGKTQTSAQISVDGMTEPLEETEVGTSKIRPPRQGLPRAAPEGLMLESATPTELTICWSPVSSEESGNIAYTVEMSKDNGYFWSPVLTGLQTTRATLPHTIVTPLQPIQLRVHAENSLGTGPPSQPVLKIPPRASVPNMHAIKPAISNLDLTSVMITWSSPTSGAPSNVSYILEVREGTKGGWKPVASGLKDKTYIYHLKPGVSTMVRVRAYNEFGTSEPSATAIVNLPVEDLIPDLAMDPPWVSVIRPDVSHTEKGGQLGLMVHWKEAYLPEYCDDCVSGLKPVYTLEWRKGRTGPWHVVDDCIVDTTTYRLPTYIVRGVQEACTSNSQSPEVRVICRNDYGSTLPTKSLRLTNFGLPKHSDSDLEKSTRPDEALLSLPIIALADDVGRAPLWLTSTDIEDGISLKWNKTFHYGDDSLHGKYRIERAVMPSSYTAETEGLWEPVGPRSQPILGDSYCLDLALHPSAEQRLRLLALTNDGSVSGWLNAYRQVRLPSKRQLLPSPVEGLRAHLIQPKEEGGVFSVLLDWNCSGQTEGERILEEQLEPGAFFTPQATSYRVEVQENHGAWREVGTLIGSSKTFFVHKTPMSGATLRYRVIPINRFGEGPEVEVPAIHTPKRLSELQGCVEDLKVLIVAPRSVFLRWRLGDEAIDALELMGRRELSCPSAARGMGDSGYEENAELRGRVSYCVERRDAFSSDWYAVATVESFQDELTGKATLRDCPKEMYGNEYRVIAFLNSQPCAPTELAPDLSYHKAKVDVSKVDEYQISYPEENLTGFFSNNILASTLPQSLEEDLTFDVEAMCGNRKEWEKIATGLPTPVFAWSGVNPLLPYSFRIVGRNQFGEGIPSRATHVDAQVVIPDLSFVVPTVREATGVLEGREPPEMRWQTPKMYNLTQTLTPFTYEVQIRRVGSGSGSDEWETFRKGLKQPRCSLEGLDPTQEYVLRVVAVTNFGRGEPSQSVRKRKSRAIHSSQSLGSRSTLGSSFDSIPPQFENPSSEVVYVPCGGDLDLRCTLASSNLKNPVQFIWFFNSQEIPNVPSTLDALTAIYKFFQVKLGVKQCEAAKHEQFPSGYFQHVTGGGKSAQLRLFDLDERDFGTYTCKAVNSFGTAVKVFKVLRADAPVITEVPLPIITLPVHHTLLLPCCVDAVPPPRITWTRDSKRLTSSHRTWIGGESRSAAQLDWFANNEEPELNELTVDASLRVERCVFQDAGLYTMIAENPAGRAQTSCIVRIEEKLSPRTITPRWSNIEKHYFVLHQIATGSFSRAHLLIDKKTSREYVGKVYALADPMTRVLGAREFECLNRLHHNNIVEMIDAVVSDDYLFLITERLSGNHLLEEVVLGHTWTEAAAAMLIKEILEAVAHVHEEGIVHLDIQPDNIIFPRGTSSRTAGLEGLMQALSSLSVDTAGAGGRSDLGVISCFVKLTGFSMAQPVGQRTTLQMASIMPPPLWCPDFAAPELLSITTAPGIEDNSQMCVGFAADVWSVGIIAYLLLFGEHPVIRNADETLKVDDVNSIEDGLADLTNASIDSYEQDVSLEAIDFLRYLLDAEPRNRPTAKECLQHPWLAEGSRSARNLENSLSNLKTYQRIYQKRKTIPTGNLRKESFLRFAGRACIEATPARPSESPMSLEAREDSMQPPRMSSSDGGSSGRGCSIDRDLTSRIATLMVPPEERFGCTGSGTSSLRSSMLHLDVDEYQMNQSPLGSPSPRLEPWRGSDGTRSPSLFSADDSSEPVKRLCDDISKGRDEQILPVEPRHCEGPLKSTNKLAPVFSNPLRDSRIDPQTNSVFFSCQLASPPRLLAPEILYQRSDVRKHLEILGMENFALGGSGTSSSGVGSGSSGSVAAAWYLGGCLLSEAPGVSLGASPDGWLWLRLNDAERGMAGKVVECVVRARHGKAKTRARILLPEPPSPPGRPGILQSASTEVLVGWTCGNDDSCEDFIYRVDVKYPDAKPVASAWRTVGYSVDRRFLISGLEPEQAYRVRVCVRNAIGWSAYSIASSEFRLHSGYATTVPLIEEEREWILRWRQAAHPFGLSDHPEAMSTTASSNSKGIEHEAFKRPPPSGVVKEMIQACGLFPHLEAVKMLCRTEGLISRGNFGESSHLLALIRCHPALVERGDLPNQRPEKQLLRLPAFLVARITRLSESSSAESLESQARQQALLLTLLRSAATITACSGLEGAPLFTQQFGIRLPSLLPQGLCLGWLANDAAKPTAGISVSYWIPGGALLDVLLARGEFTEFSVARWVNQLLGALRWLHTAFHGRLHGRVDFDRVQAARRTSTLPDIVLTGVEPIEPWEKRVDCFTAPELVDGGKCNALSDLYSVGAFAYILLLAESISTSLTDRQTSRTPTPTSEKAIGGEASGRLRKKSSTVTLPGGYRNLDRPVVNLKAIKHLSRWGRRFVYNALQLEPMSRGSLDFWLENDWFSLRPEVVKQLAANTIPSKYLRAFRPSENLYGVVPLYPDEIDPLSTV
ncbi:unnamed protein product [Hydatigera taeniaeformis]|uniref:FYVE-type domain-containing protein n=1 Tax=Hydatigena taeniaeformis TaxID=6205 RepID=A0A0R3WIF5_HYDTA|nr:unnamed protein product [Hydatigera taeniaeformis]